MIADCTAIILAGGDSRRMGRDKASLMLGGHSLLQRVIATMQQVFASVVVSVREPRPDVDLPQICDESPHAGPLAGVAAGLSHIKTQWAFVVACDMPFMTPELIEWLAAHRGEHQAVVPVVKGYPQPLAAFYAVSCLDALRENLNSEEKHSMRAVLEMIDVCYVNEEGMLMADLPLQGFVDLDTPQDVALAMNIRESR